MLNPKYKGWPADRDGYVRIRFYINPIPPPRSELAPDEIEAAILEAVRVWERASPRLRFIYLGRTDREPTEGDGFTDFAYGFNAGPSSVRNGYFYEADIFREFVDLAAHGEWHPCRQADNSCTTVPQSELVMPGTGVWMAPGDVQNTVTHELGHVLGLNDLDDDKNRYLAMNPGCAECTRSNTVVGIERFRNTLGLGDVLGIRHLYPCDCPLPHIYEP